jgi:Domain of unknown function (DUF1929)/Glyoxal oxidase N-terminus/PKD domain
MIIVLAKVLAVVRQSDQDRMVRRSVRAQFRGSVESGTGDKKMSTDDLFRTTGAAIWRLCTLVAICLWVGIGAAEKTLAQDQLKGHWETLPYLMPINPIRLGLMHTGKVLIVAGSENDADEHSQGSSKAAIWNPGTGTFVVQDMPWDVFCNGGTFLADGRSVVVGGTVEYDPFYGDPRTTVFDPLTQKFNQVHSMAHGRWYATAITLSDGRVLAFSGSDETGQPNKTLEMYTVASGWSTFSSTFVPPSYYPWLHLLPDGNVFYSGSSPTSNIFYPSAHTWKTNVAKTNYTANRTYGNSVLLPLLPTTNPATNYAARVMILGGSSSATATTEIIDFSKTPLAWSISGKMPSGARTQGNSVLLANGDVLAVGGSAKDEDASTATFGADLFNPVDGSWSSAGSNAYPRLYHSVALLLPDGTVAVAGSNPKRGTYEKHIEIYSPAYLFTTDAKGNSVRAPRPVITTAEASIGYGAGTFQVQTPNASGTTLPDVKFVFLVRPGSVTHSFDMEQRVVGLKFTSTSGALNVNLPPNPNVAPPGYYLLFLLNKTGVPSVAKFVQVSSHPTDTPPKGKITAPAGDVKIQAGQSVSFAGTASDADGSVAKYSWFFPGGNPSTSSVTSPGAIVFPSAGNFVASLTAVDNAGVNDPSPPIRTITVQPDKLVVKIVTPLANATVKGSVAVTVSATGTTGSSNAFRFGVDIDGPPLFTTTAPNQLITTTGPSATFIWNTTRLTNGVHTLWVSCKDANVNFGSANEVVTVAN